MQFAARKIALERQLVRKARQRATIVARAKEGAHLSEPEAEVRGFAVPLALLRYDKAAVKQLLAVGARRGYFTFDELNAILPDSCCSSDEIEDAMTALYGIGIDIVETEPRG
jgi:hypothetical protein